MLLRDGACMVTKKVVERVTNRLLGVIAVAACLLGLNWLTYIHGVNTDRIVETSLGYYINPLLNVVLGVLVLRERLRPLQWLAVGLASLGVGYRPQLPPA